MKNNTLVQSFAFESKNVRVIEIDNDPWFILGDVLNAIVSSTNPSDASKVIKEDLGDEFVTNYPIPDRLGRSQDTTVIHEAGVTTLISRSRTEMGRAFNRHLHAVILPTIRKTGKFVAHPEIESAPQPTHTIHDEIRKLELQVELKKLELGIYAPHPANHLQPRTVSTPIQTELDLYIVERYKASEAALLKAQTLKNEYKALSIAPKPKYDLATIENIESVEAYIRDRTKLDPNAKVYIGKADGNPNTHFYPNYINYCVEQRMAFVAMQRFSKVLMQLVYTNMGARLFKGKDRVGCHVKGIAIAS